MASVVIGKVSKSFRAPDGREFPAVRDASLEITDGELLVLVGPSGSGKTTLLRMIAGLEDPSSGSILMDGRDATTLPAHKRNVAMVFQEPGLYPHMTVFENLAFGLKLRRCPKAEIRTRVDETADVLGLAELLDRLPGALSGGERQRVALGRAMVLKPAVFLLDEPLSNLDAPLRAQMRREIATVHRRLGTSMIYVTHDQGEAMVLGHRIAVIQGGVIQQVGKPADVYREPVNSFVAQFVGVPPMNVCRGRIRQKGDAIFFHADDVTNPATDPLVFEVPAQPGLKQVAQTGIAVSLGLRAEHVQPVISAVSRKSGPVIRATVDLVETLGWETHLHLRIGGYSLVARTSGNSAHHVGETIPVALDLSQAHWFDGESGARLG